MTIEQARKEWQRISGLTILVDWKSLEDRGITPRSRIRCSVIDQPFGEALTSILQPLGLCWIAVEDGAIQIISHEQALATRETAIYDVSNFISRDGTPSGAAGAMTGTLKRRVAATLGDQAAESTIVRTDSTGGRLIVAAPQAVHRRLAVLFRPEK